MKRADDQKRLNELSDFYTGQKKGPDNVRAFQFIMCGRLTRFLPFLISMQIKHLSHLM